MKEKRKSLKNFQESKDISETYNFFSQNKELSSSKKNALSNSEVLFFFKNRNAEESPLCFLKRKSERSPKKKWAYSLMVERKTDNLEVIGSSPIVPKTNTFFFVQ